MMSQGKMLAELGWQRYLEQLCKTPSWNPALKQLEDFDGNTDRLDDTESDNESEHSDHSTDSEQSGNEDENLSSSDFTLGKDKTRWNLHPPHQNVRTRRENIVTHLPGVKSIAKGAKTRIDCWKLLFPDTLIEHIVTCTNKYLDKMRPNYSRARDCRKTDTLEILALIGLLYMAGVKKVQHVNLKELWDTDGTAPECFKATMSRERFLLLLRALQFDDYEDRDERKKTDNLAPIRRVFAEFVNRCNDCYQVGEHVTIDEMLEAFRGKCKFRQYMANKPAKYGIKIYALTDARMFYTQNLEVYCGKQPEGEYKVDNGASAVVKRLAEPILNTGRNITMDNYFTSIPLALELLQHKTTIVGTIRKNKKELPLSFLNVKNRKACSTLFGFLKKGVLVSYKPTKENKLVLVFSTFHRDNKIDEATGNATMPEIITFYNLTKGGVDTTDEMKAAYGVSGRSCRWPLTVFYSLLNIGGINCQIIFKLNTGTVENRRLFLKQLAMDLMKGHLYARSQIKTIPIEDRKRMKKLAGVQDDGAANFCEIKHGFCYYCPRRKNKKTKKTCGKCSKSICPDHTVYTCIVCSMPIRI